MTDHLRRFREYMAVEARYLAAAADRARVLDHKTNRGTDAEHSAMRWIRDRVEPEYTVSAGEVVDSFQTNVDRDSRQHDAIVHRNTRRARRFSLHSGLRLVPIETVPLIVEVKLDLDATKFKEADTAATETARLRLAVDRVHSVAGAAGPVVEAREPGPDDGLECTAPQLKGRVSFALFAFGGPKERETLAGWLKDARTIDAVCCLETGCAVRCFPTDYGGATWLSTAENALSSFAGYVDGTIGRFEASASGWRERSRAYAGEEPVMFWDTTGFDPPPGYSPTDTEIAELTRQGVLSAGWKPPPPRP